MGIQMNADEVFEMAIKIEQNGAAFYRKAASAQSDTDNQAFFETLAVMEEGHEKTFKEMRRELTEKEKDGQVFDPDGEASMYLGTAADMHGGEGSLSAADALTGEESLKDVVNIALDLENKSILYYTGLRNLVSPKRGQDKIDRIIKEEQGHVAQLSGVLLKLK